jgi:hypothetical protein
LFEFAAEEVDGGTEFGTVSEAGWEIDDLGQTREQRMRLCGVELVGAAQRHGGGRHPVLWGLPGGALPAPGAVAWVADVVAQGCCGAVRQPVCPSVREEYHVADAQRDRFAGRWDQPA